MSGPIPAARASVLAATHAVLAVLAILAILAVLVILVRSDRALSAPAVALESAVGHPIALRTERIVDRPTLERLGIPHPSRLTYDEAGDLYILDAVSRRVVKLDPAGRAILDLGGYGEDAASFSVPTDLVADRRQSLLVIDRGKNAVIAFDVAGRLLGARNVAPDVAPEAFDPAARLLTDPFGELWLLAPGERDLVPLNERLERSRRSRFLSPEGSLGTLSAAAFIPRGGVWVNDAGGRALRRFDAGGALIRSVPLVDSTSSVQPADLAVDLAGDLYVADPAGQQLLVYDGVGTVRLVRALGGATTPWRPRSIAVSRRHQVAVADPERGEIQILAIERERRP